MCKPVGVETETATERAVCLQPILDLKHLVLVHCKGESGEDRRNTQIGIGRSSLKTDLVLVAEANDE